MFNKKSKAIELSPSEDYEQLEPEKVPAKKGILSGPISLWQCLLLDGIGMLSYIIPAYGELFDVIWAPLSAIILLWKFGKTALPASVFEFVEELVPWTDFIPTFTLTYLYTRFFKKK